MKRNMIFKNALVVMAAFVAGAMATSCSDWDDHYDPTDATAGSATSTLWQNIQTNSELSQFAELVRKTGYDKILDASQTYTVWAPLNDTFDYATLAAQGNEKLLKEFVQNHIARSNYPASGVVNERVTMLNKKVLSFVGSGSYTMDGIDLSKINLPSANGVLHVLNHKLDFRANIYESLDASEFPIDSVSEYYHSFDLKVLNENKSIIGPVVNGEITYLDSVMDESNTRFNLYRALINEEDSNYTMVVPTNEAWTKALQVIAPYYKYVDNFVYTNNPVASSNNTEEVNIDAAYLTDSITHLALMQSLFFNNNLYDNGKLKNLATGQRLQCDSLVSTNMTKLYPEDAANYFEGATRVDKSNGAIFVTDSLRLHPWSFWNKPITIEAETPSVYGGVSGGTAVTREVRATEQNPAVTGTVSDDYYLEVSSSGNSSSQQINLFLPGVLSTTYHFYAVFVPAHITNVYAPDSLPATFQAQLFYNRENGTKSVAPKNLGTFVTDPTKIDTIDMGEFEFPIAYAHTGTGNTEYAPYIRISSRARSDKSFDSVLRLDCLRLVPKELDDYMREHPDYVYPKDWGSIRINVNY